MGLSLLAVIESIATNSGVKNAQPIMCSMAGKPRLNNVLNSDANV